MKKRVLIFILILGCCFACGKAAPKDNTIGILNIKENKSYTIPNLSFIVQSDGYDDQTITNKDLKKLSLYDISANVSDGFEIKEKEYVGIKLSDFYGTLKKSKYKINYFNSDNVTLGYLTSKNTGEEYLLLGVDGKDDKTISLGRFNKSTREWIFNIKTIYLTDNA